MSSLFAMLLILGGISATVATLLLLRVVVPLTRRPANAPQKCPADGQDLTVVACLGDSITHGSISANYVDMLEDRLPKDRFTLINAGVNGQLAFDLAERMDEIIACKPDYATVLVGTNDVNATLSEKNFRVYRRLQNVPRDPDPGFYRENLLRIVHRLKTETSAKIGLFSLPPIGENPSHAGFRLTGEYSEIVRSVAESTGVAYLPLREQLLNRLPGGNGRSELPETRPSVADPGAGSGPVFRAMLYRYLFGWSYDRISRHHGLTLLTDNLHLNDDSARIVAELVTDFVEKGE